MGMDDIKSIIFGIIVLGILGLAGYWAFSTMESGSSHIDSQKLKTLEKENQELKNEVSKLNSEISTLTLSKDEQASSAESSGVSANTNVDNKAGTTNPTPTTSTKTTTPTKTTTTKTTTTISKNQTLINDLQKLVDGNIYLKKGSTGTQVGTVQKFLNIYNKTSNKVDNDYGASSVTLVKNFQKAQGLTADGNAGAGTFKKMISWLKNH